MRTRTIQKEWGTKKYKKIFFWLCVNFQPYSNHLMCYPPLLAHSLFCSSFIICCFFIHKSLFLFFFHSLTLIKNSSTILLCLLKFGEYERRRQRCSVEFLWNVRMGADWIAGWKRISGWKCFYVWFFIVFFEC